MRRGEKRRFTVVFSSFPLSSFLSFPSLCLRLRSWSTVPRFWLSGSGSISAALVGLSVCWAVLFPLLLSCWLWLFWRSAAGFDLWAALPLVLSPRLFVRVSLLGLALRPLRCCLSVSRRSRVQCCGSGGAGFGRRYRPKGYSRMHNSEMVYLYDMLMAYCTKRRCFWLVIFTFCQDII